MVAMIEGASQYQDDVPIGLSILRRVDSMSFDVHKL